MDAAHIHLLINHLPIIGSMLGALVLAHGLYAKSDTTKIAAYSIFVLSSIGAVIAYLTGEGAEEEVEGFPGVLESTIEAHEEFAIYTLITLIILGIAGMAGTFLTLRKPELIKNTAIAVLAISLLSFGMAARTGYLGGPIRHTELNGGAAAPTGGETGFPSQGGDDDGDDD